MRWPAKCPAIAATSVRTGRRPSRSLIRGSRTPSIRALPLSSSVTVGTTLGMSPHSSARAVRSRIAVPLDRAIAITSTVAPVAAATSAILDRSPSTGMPVHAQPPLVRVVVEERDRPVGRTPARRAGG